ncbi:MAG TPA: hypothetical protein VHX64_04160 [Caulobacteraceae bacterium]|nr:hypothetical protein [Caulobacteraceae bacterium]
MTDRGPELEATPARQAQSGTGLRWVLRISLALIVVAFVAIWFSYAHRGSSNGAGQSAAQQTSVKEAAASSPAAAMARQQQTTGG